ncbi:MAG: RNaseH domain-containing protein [Nostoc sp.]|uniref:RNaseH domain-containing protein n=1 Tax=Nostoc sp. TaxID=1180 RepID=UPI002FFD46FF
MTSRIKAANILLPARMNLVTDAFANLEIAVLPFPFVEVVADFCHDIKQVLYRGNNREVRWPYRQLNNALLACASTLTYGFEFHSFDEESQLSLYQALAVGTPENPLKTPTPQQIHQLVRIWAQEWTKQYRDKGKTDEVNSVCDRFLERIAVIPPDWEWQRIKPETLVRDINTEKGLGFQAIPSLLATMLHENKCIINSGKTEQEIQWRKVQGGGLSKVGLYLVSKPFKTNYTDNNGKEREGYFAYRLDFNVQTQAGRFNNNGNLEPWIFLHLSCQRYPHEPLLDGNYDRDISVLMGMNKARLSDYEVDSTLVRLVIENNGKEKENLWGLQLPEVLASFKARALEQPENILNNPATLGNLNNSTNWGDRDEYYLIHVEGYGYEKRKRGHSIKTGFSFLERGDIIARVLEPLNGILIPDNPMQSDIPTPSGQKVPLAMRDYEFISRPRKGREFYQQIVADTLCRALQGKPMHIFLIYREQNTYETVYQQLRDVFLLNENQDFPAHITISKILIDNAKLLEKFDTDVGKIFAEARRDRQENKKRLQSKIKLNGTELVQFVARVLTKHLDRPTIVLIEAEGWRNGRGEDNDGKIWPQLQNENLLAKRNVLDFCHVPGNSCEYKRDNKQLQKLLAVIRIRTGKETPQYITNREAWNEDCPARDFQHLSGFYDKSAPELLHYFSIGRLPKTQKKQDEMPIPELYKLGFQEDKYGANIPFKHQQIVEMVPFFVHPDFQTEEALKALCRVPHYLRCSPAWSMGNIVLPYPMHLAQEIIEDHLCILGVNL